MILIKKWWKGPTKKRQKGPRQNSPFLNMKLDKKIRLFRNRWFSNPNIHSLEWTLTSRLLTLSPQSMSFTQNKKEVVKGHMKNNSSLKLIIMPRVINQVTSRWPKKNMGNKPMLLQILIINTFQKQSLTNQTLKFLVIKNINHTLSLKVSNRIINPIIQLVISRTKQIQPTTLSRLSRKLRNQSWGSRKRNSNQQFTKLMKNQSVTLLKSLSFRVSAWNEQIQM